MSYLPDLVGRIFGSLKVIKLVSSDRDHGRWWLCQCECGNQTTTTTGRLNSGNTRACGCGHQLKLANHRVGTTTALVRHGKNAGGAMMWLCRCDYGLERLAPAAKIASGNIPLCECERGGRSDGRTLPKMHDLKGRQFGRLTVIEQAPKRKNHASWICRCSCGKEVRTLATYLIEGTKKSCGCLRIEKKHVDLTGHTFRRLSVISLEGATIGRHAQWLCKCVCATHKVVGATALRCGNTESCGCLLLERIREKAINIQGQVFGRLTAVKRMPSQPGSKNGVQWLCRCVCGKEILTFANRLQREALVSCGCARIIRDATLTSEKSKIRGRINAQRYRARAAETGGTFTAKDVADRFRWQRGRCALPHCRERLHNVFGVDHIIPLSPRYRDGVQIANLNDRRNTQLLCLPCNSSKSDKDPIDYNRKNGFLL